MYEKKEKDTDESSPIINTVPEMSELMPESKNKNISKIILLLFIIIVSIGMITLIVLSIISFNEDQNKGKEEPMPPIDEKLYGSIRCKYLLKENIFF